MSVVAGFAGGALAATGNTAAGNTSTDATGVTHSFSATMEAGDDDSDKTLTSVKLKFPAAFDIDNVSDIDNVTVTQGGNARNISGYSQDGQTLTVTVENGTALTGSNATVNVTVEQLGNPSSANDYLVVLTVNPGSSTRIPTILAIGGGGTGELPTGIDDNTATTNTTQDRIVEIADVDYNVSAGNVSSVWVDVSAGGLATANASDISTVTVQLYNNSNDEVVASQQDVSYDADPTEVNFTGTDAATGDEIDRVRILATVDSQATDGDVIDTNYTLVDPHGVANVTDTDGTQTIVVANAGFLRGTVQDQDGNALEDVEIDIIDRNTGATVATVFSRSDGQFGNLKAAPGRYRAFVDEKGFKTFSKNVVLSVNETEDIPITLESNRYANNLSVGVWDASSQTDAGDDATNPADNESSTVTTYVVYADDQLNKPLNSSLTATLTFVNSTTVGDFVDNDHPTNQTTTVTIEPGQQADVDDDGELESYALVNVTSDNASKKTFDAVGETDGLRTEKFNATATNSQGTTLEDVSNKTYVLQGVEGISGVIHQFGEEQLSAEMANNVKVWVAYRGQTNHSYAFVNETFPYLTVESNENGHYAISGLAGNLTKITVYAKKPGYDRLNLTDTSVDAFVAWSGHDETAGTSDEVEEHNIQLIAVDRVQVYRVTVWVNGSQTARNPVGDTDEVLVQVEVKPQGADDTEFTPAAATDVELTLNETDVGDLAGSNSVTLTTDASGNATTTFEADLAGVTNITATVTNDDGTEFSGNATKTVFGTASIEGDVADDENTAIGGDSFLDEDPDREWVRIVLYRQNKTTGDFEQITDTLASPTGDFTFTGQETGYTYRTQAIVKAPNASGTPLFTANTTFDVTTSGTKAVSIVVEDPDLENGVEAAWTTGSSGTEHELANFDADGDEQIEFTEVLDAISAFNDGTQVGGESVSFQDVLDVINAFNTDEQISA